MSSREIRWEGGLERGIILPITLANPGSLSAAITRK
jgi:hypothetical protein